MVFVTTQLQASQNICFVDVTYFISFAVCTHSLCHSLTAYISVEVHELEEMPASVEGASAKQGLCLSMHKIISTIWVTSSAKAQGVGHLGICLNRRMVHSSIFFPPFRGTDKNMPTAHKEELDFFLHSIFHHHALLMPFFSL